jgi:hypothetical protein
MSDINIRSAIFKLTWTQKGHGNGHGKGHRHGNGNRHETEMDMKRIWT